MINPPLQGRSLEHVGYMLLFDAVVLWALFSWQYLDMLISGERRPTESLVNAVLVGIASLVALALTMKMPQRWKDAIVFWRLRNAFCSRRAFSELAQNDYRYRPEELEQRIGPFPTDPAEQRSRWNALYAKYEGLAMVVQMRRQYLLCYEIAALSLFMIAPMLVLVAIRWSSQELVWMGPCFLIGQYIMFVIAARFMGDNLVQAVLAIEATGS